MSSNHIACDHNDMWCDQGAYFLLICHYCDKQTYSDMQQVTGNNLVPMTLQKQNVVTAVIADVLTPSAVFYINCTAVNQVSAAPGSNSSTAVVSLVLQQDADAVYIGHVTFLTLPCNFLLPSPSQPHHLSLCRPSPARPPHTRRLRRLFALCNSCA